jgi:lipid-A-disaccharide synthase
MAPRFAMVAGEDSGDILGADLIQALKKRYPDAIFEGIGGWRMCAQGLVSFYPLERLAVMGLFEPLKRLPELISIFYHLKRHFTATRPTVFIGIDAPDFNLRLEKALKSKGIKTVHYVSPTVWAWRPGRIKTIKKSVDLMLGLFPFEKQIYQDNHIPMAYVGHPLADSIPMVPDVIDARRKLNISLEGKYVALMPGSRRQELDQLLIPFIQTAQWLLQKDPHLRFLTACVNEQRMQQWTNALKAFPNLPIEIILGRSMEVMSASDAVLLASGTASLQSMLVKKPTVVAYKMSPLTFQIAKRIINVPYISLPNLLAGKALMPEYIQSDVVPEKMGGKIWEFLTDPNLNQATLASFKELHHLLRKNAGQSAAIAIDALIKDTLCELQESMRLDEAH